MRKGVFDLVQGNGGSKEWKNLTGKAGKSPALQSNIIGFLFFHSS